MRNAAWPFLWLAMLSPVLGQGPARLPLSLDATTPGSLNRSGGPVIVDWTLNWDGNGLLEGVLECALLDDAGTVLYVYRSDERVLQPGQQQFQSLLPPMIEPAVVPQVTVEGRFVTVSGTIELGKRLLRIPTQNRRCFVLAEIVGDLEFVTPLVQRVDDRLSYDRIREDRWSTATTTVSVRLMGDSLPTEPLAYAAFDVVVIFPEAWARIRRPALAAIEPWLRAGGSVVVMPGPRMNRDHLDLLNAWFSQEARGNTAFVLTDAGQFLPAADWGGFRRAACDRGRIVYLAEALEANDPRWRSASAWVWKVRRDRQADVESGVAYLDAPVPGAPVDAVPPQAAGLLIDPTSSQPQPLQTTDWVIDQLMPEEAETVPLWTVGLILAVFVVIIGPVDYYLLGRLRRRVWTWVTYPAWTILCTAFIVWLANESMQMADVRRSLIIRDLAPDGRLLMENRIELLIAGRRRTAVHRAARELAAPMDRRALTRADYVASLSDVARPAPAVLAGQLPRNYVVSQELWQWTPELRRTLRLEFEGNRPGRGAAERRALADSPGADDLSDSGGSEPRAPAHAVDWKMLGRYAPNDPELLALLQRQLGDDLDVRTFSQKHGQRVLRQRAERQRVFSPAWTARTPYVRGGMPGLPSMFLADVAARDVGIHKVVSRISPSGSPTLEDLPTADLSNPDEWMLCVLVREGTHLVLYRIIYPVPVARDPAADGAS